MIPRVASRGHSFVGAGAYYLHDKGASTNDRVAWTYTHNLPTNDASKAINYMAYTAMHSDQLKNQAGVKNTGRKAKAGSVYSYSLAWHPEENPLPDYMQAKALETLSLLGLSEHEAVLVAHQETDHSHVHVIVNLVHPETGKTAVVYKDRVKLSQWAEEYEKQKGKIYCEERVANNEIRKGQIPPEEKKLTKGKEEQLNRANLIHELYKTSDSGQAFQAALSENGYALATGNRRDYVIIDEAGKIHSLTRHLNQVIDKENNKLWRSELEDRLSQLKLGIADELLKNRANTSKLAHEGNPYIPGDMEVQARRKSIQDMIDRSNRLNKMDWDNEQGSRLSKLEGRLDQYYNSYDINEQIESLSAEIENTKKSWLSKITNKQTQMLKELEALKKQQSEIEERKLVEMNKLRSQISDERTVFHQTLDAKNVDDVIKEFDSIHESLKPKPVPYPQKEERDKGFEME